MRFLGAKYANNAFVAERGRGKGDGKEGRGEEGSYGYFVFPTFSPAYNFVLTCRPNVVYSLP